VVISSFFRIVHLMSSRTFSSEKVMDFALPTVRLDETLAKSRF